MLNSTKALRMRLHQISVPIQTCFKFCKPFGTTTARAVKTDFVCVKSGLGISPNNIMLPDTKGILILTSREPDKPLSMFRSILQFILSPWPNPFFDFYPQACSSSFCLILADTKSYKADIGVITQYHSI